VKDFFNCEHRGKISTKEKKEYDMYFVRDILPTLNTRLEQGIPAGFQRRYRTYFRQDLSHFPDIPGDEADQSA